MREYRFRGKRLDNGEWVYGYYYIQIITHAGNRKSRDHFIRTEQNIRYEVDPETVGQYTGLHDNTKWEQLSELEKMELYNKHCSEDGKTIKYQRVDDVKHLWNGKEIYEGDIVKVRTTLSSPYEGETVIGFVVYDERFAGYIAKNNFMLYGDLAFSEEVEKIGDVFDNPELLKGDESV